MQTNHQYNLVDDQQVHDFGNQIKQLQTHSFQTQMIIVTKNRYIAVEYLYHKKYSQHITHISILVYHTIKRNGIDNQTHVAHIYITHEIFCNIKIPSFTKREKQYVTSLHIISFTCFVLPALHNPFMSTENPRYDIRIHTILDQHSCSFASPSFAQNRALQLFFPHSHLLLLGSSAERELDERDFRKRAQSSSSLIITMAREKERELGGERKCNGL